MNPLAQYTIQTEKSMTKSGTLMENVIEITVPLLFDIMKMEIKILKCGTDMGIRKEAMDQL